ncbi:MAG: nicotinate-nucleotide adenylyltransferase [Moraxellaceae bacterium]|nr:nicotinate-nucleotide adenylyltransferase [Moraxellaceae bacterium]
MTLPTVIGLYGGSFDPVHTGHTALADALLAILPLKEIRFLPAARSPLKSAATADTHRLAMLRLALAGKERLTVDARELDRPAPSYTIDTLRALRAEVGPAVPLAFILGQDSYLDLPRWKDWEQLTDLAHLVVVNRPGATNRVGGTLAAHAERHRLAAPGLLESRPAGGLLFVDTPPHAIASRDIRASIRTGTLPRDWLCPAVRDYIDQHHLYAGDADPQ